MFHRSLALAAALLGAASASHEGCYPAYTSSGKYYTAGDVVSAKGEIATTEDCDPAEAGCPADGKKTVTETADFNYECETGVWCSNPGYAPGGIYSDLAWKELHPCQGTAVIAAASAPLPDLGGCPAEFSDSAEYGGGDRVSVCEAGTEWCDVYQCEPSLPAYGKYCQEPGFEPGSSLYWDQAWDKVEGSCSGTIAPTPAVSLDGMDDVGGCPSAYDSGAKYEAGDRVSKDNLVFECKPWPFDGWCGLVGYEPMEDVATIGAWNEAWNVIGYCSGTIAPTSAPNFVSLKKLGGCPAEWELGTNGFGYDEGDRVAKGGLVFECKSWPFSAHCGQAGYEPLESPSTPDAWKDAWSVVGFCEGTLSPSSIAGLDLENLKNLGVCPKREYVTLEEYGSGEQVKVCEPVGSECCAVYQCATDNPNPSGWCGQVAYEPGEGWAWKDAWSLEGYCCGTNSPSTSPSKAPTNSPSTAPTKAPSSSPSTAPTKAPSSSPSTAPTNSPSTAPTKAPSSSPSTAPAHEGSFVVSFNGPHEGSLVVSLVGPHEGSLVVSLDGSYGVSHDNPEPIAHDISNVEPDREPYEESDAGSHYGSHEKYHAHTSFFLCNSLL